MAYNIKLFVHGVPNGQDIWGNPGSDAKYIEAIYGRKSNVASQMILEVMQFGGETNAYYTYLYYNDKIQDKQNRTGGYFALTLRINYYYADIQNIYNLLEAAFNKYIIGSVLEYTTGGGCRFIVSQLNQANENFIALEKEMKHYLMQFSSNKDFVSLAGFKSNGQNECITINLLEATSNVVLKHVKSTGKISVSPHHLTSKEQQIINKMNSEVQAANLNAQQQIAFIQRKAQQDVQAAQKDKERGIQEIKNEYKEADKTINQLRIQIDKDNKDITKLSVQVNDLNLKLQDTKIYKTQYEENQRKLEKAEKLIADIKKNLSELNGISELLGISSVKTELNGRVQRTKMTFRRILDGFSSFVKKIHPFVDFFVMIIFLLIICMILVKSCNNNDNSFSSHSLFDGNKEEYVEMEDTELTEEKNFGETTEDGDVHISDDQDIFESLKQKYPKARINIDPMNEDQGNFMRVNSGISYTISIVGTDEELKGEWVYNHDDFYIQDGNIIPKRPGVWKIIYRVNGIEFLDKIVNVKP